MSNTLKKSLIIIASIILVFMAALVFADYYVEKKITEKLNSLPEHIKVSYDELDVSILGSSLNVYHPNVEIFSRVEDELNLHIKMNQLRVIDLSYWDYLFNDAITIDSIAFESYEATYRHDKRIRHKQYKSRVSERLDKFYKVNTIKLSNGTFKMIDDAADTLQLKTENLNLILNDVELNNTTKDEKIPFAVRNFEMSSDSLFYRLSEFENMNVASVDASLNHTGLKGIKLKTKYSKAKFDRLLKKERDHFDLEIDSVNIGDQDFGYVNDSTPYFKAGIIKIANPVFKVYRNKLIADDNSIKHLYSKKLRDLNLRLTIDHIDVENGLITYSELVRSGHPAGELEFEKIDATIQNLSNTYPKGEQTKIHVNSHFMEGTPLEVDWSFDVNNESDFFTFKGQVGEMPVDDINAFIKPNQNIMLEGKLLKTYFNIGGDTTSSNIDLKIDYDNFKVVVLRKDGKEKNNFLSAVANIFVKKSSQNEDNDFRNGSKTTVERDKTKSVFNYVWINLGAALIDAML